MNWGQIVATLASFILGIGAVWKIVEKFSPKVKKYVHIATEALALLDTVLTATEDKKIDEVEIKAIREKADALMADFKK